MEDVVPDEESTLFDLTQVSLAQWSALENRFLACSLWRLLEEADDPPEAIACFQSSVGVWD